MKTVYITQPMLDDLDATYYQEQECLDGAEMIRCSGLHCLDCIMWLNNSQSYMDDKVKVELQPEDYTHES